MKQTAVEWAINEIRNNWYDYEYGDADMDDLIKQAKEMEKQQIIEAHGDKQKTKSNPDSLVTYGYWYSGKDYYKSLYIRPTIQSRKAHYNNALRKRILAPLCMDYICNLLFQSCSSYLFLVISSPYFSNTGD